MGRFRRFAKRLFKQQVPQQDLPSPDATLVEATALLSEAVMPSTGTEADGVPVVWHEGDIILDLYEVTALLGEGGMGRVHKVHHRGWNVDLAVKSPHPHIFAGTAGQELFVREAETWVNLGLHPHIVNCAYVRTIGDIPRVFAEYVEGGSLADWVRDRRLYAGGPEEVLARILDIAIQFAWGLEYAHQPKPKPAQEEPEPGLVHQDVKPANVMMTLDGIAKVTDFGLAKARVLAGEVASQGGAGRSIMVPGAGMMTLEYRSPEQAAGQPLTRRTDIWSWGVSVLELFTGGRTWLLGEAAAEILEGYLAEGPPDVSIPRMPA